MRAIFLAALSLLLLALLCSCSLSPPSAPAYRIPWTDGETTNYDVLSPAGRPVGTAWWSWRRDGDQWRQSFELTIRGKKDTGEVVADANLRTLRSTRETGGSKFEATYGDREIVVRATESGGAPSDKSIPVPAIPLDNDISLEAQRALPLADGYVTEYDSVVARSGATARIRLSVVGAEVVTVPAGTFDTWHVKLSGAGRPHEVWYAKAPPHQMIKYHNLGSGSQFVLRSWKASADAPLQGDSSAPQMAEGGAVPLNWGYLAAALFVAFPLMMLLPVALGFLLSRKLGATGKLWGLGALAFVTSQVVHLPLNWAVGLLGTPRLLGTLPLPWLALAAGLSAGLCEELARYVFLRFAARKAKHTWSEALQFGAGHGGIEAIILGALLGLSVIAMLVLRFVPASLLGIPSDAAAEIAAAGDTFWSQPWHGPVVGGLERLSAVTAHIGMTVLVMRAVARRNPLYLLAAIAVHTAIDAFAVWSIANLGVTWTEAGVAVMAAALLVLIFALRDEKTPAQAEGSPPAPRLA